MVVKMTITPLIDAPIHIPGWTGDPLGLQDVEEFINHDWFDPENFPEEPVDDHPEDWDDYDHRVDALHQMWD